MQLDELGLGRDILKVKACYLSHVVAQFSPCIGLGEDGLPQRPRHLAALFRLALFEDQFHAQIRT